MNEREYNLAILAELKKVANEVFAKVTINGKGTYTAAELCKGKNSMGDPVFIKYNGTENDIHTIEVGTSKYRVPSEKIWYAVWQFEKLCHVRQQDKARFTYGDSTEEIISEKAMYFTGHHERTYGGTITGEGNYKVLTRKHTMKKLSSDIAIDKQERVFYKFGDIWYLVSTGNGHHVADKITSEHNFIRNALSKFNFEQEGDYVPIYKALFDAMQNTTAKSMPKGDEPKKEPEKMDATANNFSIHEALRIAEEKFREKYSGYIALILFDEMYYAYGQGAKKIRLTDGAHDYITDTGDYVCFPKAELGNVLPKLVATGYKVLTCGHIEAKQKLTETRDETSDKELPGKPSNTRRKIKRFKTSFITGSTSHHATCKTLTELNKNDFFGIYGTPKIRGHTWHAFKSILINKIY